MAHDEEVVTITELASTPELIKIRDVFAAGRPEELGALRNDILAAVLTELVGYRTMQDAEEQAARALAEGHEVDTLTLTAARFKLALSKLQQELDRRIGVSTSQYGQNIIECLDLLTALLLQHATEPGDLPGRGDMAGRDRSGG